VRQTITQKDAADFLRRIKLLSRYDLEYLVRLILSGEESLGCVPFNYITLFVENVSERLGEEIAAQVRKVIRRFRMYLPEGPEKAIENGLKLSKDLN